MVTLQIMASLMADVELADVTGASLESDTLQCENGKRFLRRPKNGLLKAHRLRLQCVVDATSLCEHLMSLSSPWSVEDK